MDCLEPKLNLREREKWIHTLEFVDKLDLEVAAATVYCMWFQW
jgi:hypothetical protein